MGSRCFSVKGSGSGCKDVAVPDHKDRQPEWDVYQEERRQYFRYIKIVALLWFLFPALALIIVSQYFLCKTEYRCLCSEHSTVEFKIFLGPIIYLIVRQYPTRDDRDRRALRGFCTPEPPMATRAIPVVVIKQAQREGHL